MRSTPTSLAGHPVCVHLLPCFMPDVSGLSKCFLLLMSPCLLHIISLCYVFLFLWSLLTMKLWRLFLRTKVPQESMRGFMWLSHEIDRMVISGRNARETDLRSDRFGKATLVMLQLDIYLWSKEDSNMVFSQEKHLLRPGLLPFIDFEKYMLAWKLCFKLASSYLIACCECLSLQTESKPFLYTIGINILINKL